MSKAASTNIYTPDEIARRLKSDLPLWRLADGELTRRYQTGGWKATLMAINALGFLAETAWHHPEIRASFGWVEVRLSSHDVKGITEQDFALAAKIEALLTWRRASEDGPFEEPPSDAAVIKPE